MWWRSRLLPSDLAQRVLARDRDAVAEALNLVEDRREGPRAAALELLDRIEREALFPGAPRIGITGPPGAGKSSLLDALLRQLRPRGERIAIVAVDPSSQRSGGALLGDRIRVRAAAADPGVFLRSMAARDRLGGLSEATRAAVVILGAAFDRVFVETVGVGQSEIEAAALVDTLVYVANPGTGDWLQFMKAGVLETPDIFVVNKSDLGAPARATAAELEGGIGLGEAIDTNWKPPVILVSAREADGMARLVLALDAHRQALEAAGVLRERRRRGDESWILDGLERRYGTFGLERCGGREALRARLAEGPAVSPFARLAQLGREIEDALRKPL
jgi:LAO/AO transport system kinase